MYAVLCLPIRATCPAHRKLLEITALTIIDGSTNHEVPAYGIAYTVYVLHEWSKQFPERFCFETCNFRSLFTVRGNVSQSYKPIAKNTVFISYLDV
jgi:hypothetical protein